MYQKDNKRAEVFERYRSTKTHSKGGEMNKPTKEQDCPECTKLGVCHHEWAESEPNDNEWANDEARDSHNYRRCVKCNKVQRKHYLGYDWEEGNNDREFTAETL